MSDVSYVGNSSANAAIVANSLLGLRSEAEALIAPSPVPAASSVQSEDLPTRTLSQDEYLYREGEAKRCVYRVESGALCVTTRTKGGAPELIGLAYPGDLVGLGFLDTHIESASAVCETKVSIWSRHALHMLCQGSPQAESRQADTTEREFVYQRQRLVSATVSSPLRRVAGFLLVVARLNEIEGRNADVISENLRSGEVAEFLGMDVDTLARQLRALQQQELISLTGVGGLRIEKRGELESLVDLAA